MRPIPAGIVRLLHMVGARGAVAEQAFRLTSSLKRLPCIACLAFPSDAFRCEFARAWCGHSCSGMRVRAGGGRVGLLRWRRECRRQGGTCSCRPTRAEGKGDLLRSSTFHIPHSTSWGSAGMSAFSTHRSGACAWGRARRTISLTALSSRNLSDRLGHPSAGVGVF